MTLGLLDRYLRRAALGLKREARLHIGAAASLASAFVLVGIFGLVSYNLGRSVEAWGMDLELTAYLRDGATPEETTASFRFARGLGGVAQARLVTAEEAQRRLASPGGPGASAFAGLPSELFPASIELKLQPGAQVAERAERVAERMKALPAIEDVDSVAAEARRLDGVMRLSGVAGLAIAIVVLLGALSIVSSTLLVTQHRRRDEIELLRLCGATDGFLRVPLLLEGAVQSLGGAILALAILLGVYLVLEGPAGGALGALGIVPRFLPAWMVGLALVGAALLGALGSQISFRRSIRV
ncbi:MAG: hypothetical protein HYY06_30480 [Deltaproteobacteria bacterium]|nr:hypothetical protein [Deltaproteobacteria bacterium]